MQNLYCQCFKVVLRVVYSIVNCRVPIIKRKPIRPIVDSWGRSPLASEIFITHICRVGTSVTNISFISDIRHIQERYWNKVLFLRSQIFFFLIISYILNNLYRVYFWQCPEIFGNEAIEEHIEKAGSDLVDVTLTCYLMFSLTSGAFRNLYFILICLTSNPILKARLVLYSKISWTTLQLYIRNMSGNFLFFIVYFISSNSHLAWR